jgi:hypothetical protein
VQRRPGAEAEGAPPDFGRQGSKQKWAGKGRGKRRIKGKGFDFLKALQTNEFKYKFEFKHSKAMHQHVCNIKLQ